MISRRIIKAMIIEIKQTIQTVVHHCDEAPFALSQYLDFYDPSRLASSDIIDQDWLRLNVRFFEGITKAKYNTYSPNNSSLL